MSPSVVWTRFFLCFSADAGGLEGLAGCSSSISAWKWQIKLTTRQNVKTSNDDNDDVGTDDTTMLKQIEIHCSENLKGPLSLGIGTQLLMK